MTERLHTTPFVTVIMGVTGSGKTTIGTLVAAQLGAEFCDADDLHSADARRQMRAGVPLTDADRWPWLERVAARIRMALEQQESLVLACSALKRRYREVLNPLRHQRVRVVYLAGSPHLFAQRLAGRAGHFMSPALLDSQLDDLEPPSSDENALTVINDGAPEDAARQIAEALCPCRPVR